MSKYIVMFPVYVTIDADDADDVVAMATEVLVQSPEYFNEVLNEYPLVLKVNE